MARGPKASGQEERKAKPEAMTCGEDLERHFMDCVGRCATFVSRITPLVRPEDLSVCLKDPPWTFTPKPGATDLELKQGYSAATARLQRAVESGDRRALASVHYLVAPLLKTSDTHLKKLIISAEEARWRKEVVSLYLALVRETLASRTSPASHTAPASPTSTLPTASVSSARPTEAVLELWHLLFSNCWTTLQRRASRLETKHDNGSFLVAPFVSADSLHYAWIDNGVHAQPPSTLGGWSTLREAVSGCGLTNIVDMGCGNACWTAMFHRLLLTDPATAHVDVTAWDIMDCCAIKPHPPSSLIDAQAYLEKNLNSFPYMPTTTLVFGLQSGPPLADQSGQLNVSTQPTKCEIKGPAKDKLTAGQTSTFLAVAIGRRDDLFQHTTVSKATLLLMLWPEGNWSSMSSDILAQFRARGGRHVLFSGELPAEDMFQYAKVGNAAFHKMLAAHYSPFFTVPQMGTGNSVFVWYIAKEE